jgi:hypothetical protein
MSDQIFGSGLNLGGQQYAMADEPPPPVSGNKPPADPIRPVPMRAAPVSPEALYGVREPPVAAVKPRIGIAPVPKGSPLNRPSNRDASNFTRTPMDIPPELTTGGGNAEYLGRGSNVTTEWAPKSPDVPMTRELVKSQRELDQVLARAQKAAGRYTSSVKEQNTIIQKMLSDQILRIQERLHALSEGGTAPADEMGQPMYKGP